MKIGEINCKQADGMCIVERMDNWSVIHLTIISRPDNTITVELREKDRAVKKNISFPTIIQEYNRFTDAFNIIDKKKYSNEIDRGSKIKRFTWHTSE